MNERSFQCPLCRCPLKEASWSRLPLLGWVGGRRRGAKTWAVEMRRCALCEQPIGLEVLLPLVKVTHGP